MSKQNIQLNNLDHVVKDSLLYLRQNYRQLFSPFVLTCVALFLFSLARILMFSFLYSLNVPTMYPHTYLFQICEHSLELLSSLSYLLVFPIMLLVTRGIVLGSQVSLEEFRNQPKQRIIHVLLAIAKLIMPLHIFYFIFNKCLWYLKQKLSLHIIAGQLSSHLVNSGSDNSWPFPLWVYDNALDVTNWGMLILIWYIASRWSMTLVFAALDKTLTFKQSAAFTKEYVGLIFFSITFAKVFFYTLGLGLFEAISLLIVSCSSPSCWEQGSFWYVNFLTWPLGYTLTALQWILYAVILSKIYLLIENKGK